MGSLLWSCLLYTSNIKEETSATKTRSPPKKTKVEQTVPKKKKLKTDADKAAEKAQHLLFGKAELTPDELSRLSKAQKREMYAAHAARSAVHREVDQYEDDNVGTQALSEGEKATGNVRDISKSRYARKLKKKAKMQGKKGSKIARSSASEPTAAQDAGASCTLSLIHICNLPPFFSDFKYSFKRILEYKIPSFISSSSTMESLSKKFSFSLR